MKTAAFTLFALLIAITATAQIKLETRNFFNGKLQILIPATFKQMDQATIDAKYPNRSQQPDAVLTDEDATVNVVISYLSQHMDASQVAQYKDFQLSQLKKSRPDAEWLGEGVQKVNGKDIGYIKFMIKAIDQKVFNDMFFAEFDGRILVISFNCTEKKLPEWKDAAEQIFSSIRLK